MVLDWQMLYATDISQLAEAYGQPVLRSYVHDVDQTTWDYWRRLTKKRTSEVVMLLRRPGDLYVVHTKPFYPQGIYRLLSGGLNPNESLYDAALREGYEETGLSVQWDRFLAITRHSFAYQGKTIRFVSYLVSLTSHQGPLQNQDEGEQISGYREVSLSDLGTLANTLELLPPDWVEWGRFRAPAHRLAVELLAQ